MVARTRNPHEMILVAVNNTEFGNKHVGADKVSGFWNYAIHDPGDYVGTHRKEDQDDNS
jgi:hypothetical protein